MKFLVVAVVCVCMFLVCDVANANLRGRRVLRAPVRVAKNVLPIHTARKNVSCRVETRKARRTNRRSN